MILLTTLALADGGVVGIVFDATGAPIAGARVVIAGEATITDAWGAWQLSVSPGPGTVHVEAPGRPALDVPDVPVVEGRTTELLVTLGTGTVSLEAPPASAPERAVALGPPGVVTGVVRDEAQAPLPGVRLFVRGLDSVAVSDRQGAFRMEIPEGTWDISAIRAGYTTGLLSVEVVANGEQAVALSLVDAGLALSDLVVKAPRIAGGAASVLDERKEASTVSDVLGAEQMSKSGDGDAAAALRRVTGLTVIGGKYVYVRGLGDRYSATLLNGSSLPSPEPEKRVVPLDMFPTSLIEAVVIQKTFSPDRPAEFGGGVVEVRTRAIPKDPVFNIGLSGSWDAGTTFEEGEVGAAGPTDWLGFGADWRALPAEVASASAEEPLKSAGRFTEGGYTADELERFGELLPNRWGHTTRVLPPDLGLTLNAGRRLPIGPVEVGALVGVVYANGWDIDEGTKSSYASGADGLTVSRVADFTETSNKIRLGGALAVGLEWGEHLRLTSTTLLNRGSVATAISYDADDPTGSNDSHSQRTSWEEQQLLFEQLSVHGVIGPVDIDARYATATATRREPDRREVVYIDTDEGYVLSQRGSWNDIQYLSLDDHTRDGGLDISVHIPKIGKDAVLKVGGSVVERERDSTTRRFAYSFHGSEGIDLGAPAEDVIVDENIGAEEDGDLGYLQIEENTINSDDYGATQKLYAAYAMGDVAWTPRIRTLAGARVERSEQAVSTFEMFDTTNKPVVAELGSTDWLPAATVTIGVGPSPDPDRMLVRAGYGRTVSRPEFRELSQVQFYDYRSGRTLYGNPDLHRATIDNVDVRWEWYPRAGEGLSVGLFYKYFDQPIESVVAVSAVSGSVGTFDNAASATNFGAELDARQRLDIVHPALSDLSVSANVSFIRSRVDLSDTDGNQTSEERPLQGQSPWVLNAQIAWENPDIRTSISALYNVFGPRIVDVGTSGIPDVYEMPVHRVDLVVTQGIGPHLQVRAKIANLLDWPSREMTGEQISHETRDGWSAGLGLTWTP